MTDMRLDNRLFLHHHNDLTDTLDLVSAPFFKINNDERHFFSSYS